MQIGDYVIKPKDKKTESELVEFLKFNDFKYCKRFENNSLNGDYVIVVNTVHKFYFTIDKFYIITETAMDEREFYKKVNYLSDEVAFEKIFSDDEDLVYEGYTACGYPYGFGRLYFDNGNIYQEGIFDFKGLREGKEYYYNGQLKFEGIWSMTNGYGPNAPRIGNVYDEKGKMVFSGKFEIKKGGVGWPMIKYPSGYRNNEKNRPDIKYIRGPVLLELEKLKKK